MLGKYFLWNGESTFLSLLLLFRTKALKAVYTVLITREWIHLQNFISNKYSKLSGLSTKYLRIDDVCIFLIN